MLACQVHRSDRRQETPVGDRGLCDAWPCRQQGHGRDCVVPCPSPTGDTGACTHSGSLGSGNVSLFLQAVSMPAFCSRGARPLLSSKAVSCTDVLEELVGTRAVGALLAGCAECERWWEINFHTLRSCCEWNRNISKKANILSLIHPFIY